MSFCPLVWCEVCSRHSYFSLCINIKMLLTNIQITFSEMSVMLTHTTPFWYFDILIVFPFLSTCAFLSRLQPVFNIPVMWITSLAYSNMQHCWIYAHKSTIPVLFYLLDMLLVHSQLELLFCCSLEIPFCSQQFDFYLLFTFPLDVSLTSSETANMASRISILFLLNFAWTVECHLLEKITLSSQNPS